MTIENKKTEKILLEGALGYIAHLQEVLHKGKLKSLEEVSKKIGEDGITISSVLAEHCGEALKWAGWTCGLFEEPRAKKEAEKND